MNILVTDGENRSALAVTRSLGKRDCNVFVVGTDLENISARSRFCRKAYKVPDPLHDDRHYAEVVCEIVRQEAVDVIFPMTEQSIYSLNKVREQLEKYAIVACAPHGQMEAVSNKNRLHRLAESVGVAIPETIYVTGIEDFHRQKGWIEHFPVVVKPAFSKIDSGKSILPTKVMYAANGGELELLFETVPALQHPAMIQELIVGPGTGLFTLFDKDRHLVLFSHQRLLEKPPSGGVSVLSESVVLDDEMVDSAAKLLSAVAWQGIAMVEFKRDLKDGKAKLMEINGRFWGSLQLAVSSGVDFPALCLEYYLGCKPAALMAHFAVGQRLKWFNGLLDHLIIRLKNDDRVLHVPAGSPSRCQVVRELLKRGDKNTSYDVYDRNDLQPFVSEMKAYVKNIIGKKND